MLKAKRDRVKKQLSGIKVLLDKADTIKIIIEKTKELRVIVEDSDKISTAPDEDNKVKSENINLLLRYEAALKSNGLGTVEQLYEYLEKHKKYSDKFHVLSDDLGALETNLRDFEDCLKTLKRIAKDSQKLENKETANKYSEKSNYRNGKREKWGR